MQLDNKRNITEYVENEHEIARLKAEGLTDNDTKVKIVRLVEENKKNPVAPLMEAGMYQSIIEDLDTQDYKSKNVIANFAQSKIGNLPEYVKNGANWAYLSEKTGVFQFVQRATQYSDFIARATEYQILKEKGVADKVAKQTVLDAFINYGKPSSSFEEYLNNIGMVMFTKYAKRIRRAIKSSVGKKPLNIILSILGQEMFFEADDIWDQNPITRSYTNLNQDFMAHIEKAFTHYSFSVCRYSRLIKVYPLLLESCMSV